MGWDNHFPEGRASHAGFAEWLAGVGTCDASPRIGGGRNVLLVLRCGRVEWGLLRFVRVRIEEIISRDKMVAGCDVIGNGLRSKYPFRIAPVDLSTCCPYHRVRVLSARWSGLSIVQLGNGKCRSGLALCC